MFSLAPILLIAISIAGWIYGSEAASTGLLQEVRTTIGPTAADAIEATLNSVQESGGGAGMTIVGFLASGMFGVLLILSNNGPKSDPVGTGAISIPSGRSRR